ncbi:MAG: AMP-binding protein [Candidatus Omnitrophica bacterium]|nr:AMP-binding protein [Candidatus Omnitrophota bacterium]
MNKSLLITEFLQDAVLRFKDKAVLQAKMEGGGWVRFTYHELEEQSRRIAVFLIKEGFKKGDRACLISENCPEWAFVYFGIIYAGLTCVPVDPQSSREEIENILSDSNAKVIFCSGKVFVDKIRLKVAQNTAFKVILLNAINEKEIKNISLHGISCPEITPQDIASLIYTSGTTGKPKGVLLSHSNICSNFLSLQKTGIYSSSDNFLAILPLYHTYAFMATLVVPLFSGAKVTFCYSLNSVDIVKAIHESKVTVFAAVPQVLSMIHKGIFERLKRLPFLFKPFVFPYIRLKVRRKFKGLKFLISGGARLDPKINRDLYKIGLKVIEGYGLTETSPVVTLNPPEKIKFGSAGKPIPDIEVKILNPNKDGIGQVLIKGPNVMQGYYRRPDLTKEALKDSWFYSADLGFIDKEGYLFLSGRESEVIVLSSGKNIYPEELEEYYLRSPYIKEICIVAHEEKVFGRSREVLFAVIVPDLDFFSKAREPNIRDKIRWELDNSGKGLPSYRHIMGFTLTNKELPRTVLKKIKRHEVKEIYLCSLKKNDSFAEEALPQDKAILEKKHAGKIIRYISSHVNKPVHPHSHLEIDLGIDSLAKVELGLGLEALLGIEMPDELFYAVSTVRDLIAAVENITGGLTAEIPQPMVNRKGWDEILKEAPLLKTKEAIKLEFGVLEHAVTIVFKYTFLLFFKVFWFLRVRGRENLSPQGPFLICPNHASYLDGLFIFCSLPFKVAMNTYFLGFQQIFEHPYLKWGNRIARMISIDAATHLTEAMQAVSYVAGLKKIICIFPEGMRSIDEKVKDFKKGVGILIKELNIPVVPAYIRGSHHSWPRGSRLPRFHPVEVTFGKPVTFKELEKNFEDSAGFSDDYDKAAKALREEVLKISGNKGIL